MSLHPHRMNLPAENEVIRIVHKGKVFSAIVEAIDHVQPDAASRRLQLWLATPLQQGDMGQWIDDAGNRERMTVEESTTEWGMTSARVLLEVGATQVADLLQVWSEA